jgi:AFG3 family protein
LNTAQVYVRPSTGAVATGANELGQLAGTGVVAAAGAGPARFKYWFNIGSVESFERKLEEAQDIMGLEPREYVPVSDRAPPSTTALRQPCSYSSPEKMNDLT